MVTSSRRSAPARRRAFVRLAVLGLSCLLALSTGAAAAEPPAPRVLYTDLASGPNRGGENGKGVWLSIFGRDFGDAAELGRGVKVLIGGAEVERYRYHGASRGRPDVQQITVQVGALGDPPPGRALPVQVVVNGRGSNTDHTFTVNPGRILFVDNVLGDDATARADDPDRPWRTLQTPAMRRGGLWPQVRPGDVIVLRGRGADAPWTDVGYRGYFLRVADRSGSAPTGAPGTGPITITGHPDEDVFIRGRIADGMKGGCIGGVDGKNYPGIGQWVTVANLRMDCEGYDGPITQQIHGHDWRIVNNDLAMSTAPRSGPSVPRAAGVVANGLRTRIWGNHIHDVQGSAQECHGIYIDGDGSYDIAWNLIHDIRDGNGFQVYVNGTNGSDWADEIRFHHNLIREVSKHGINLADNARRGVAIWNNVVSRAQGSGLRINSLVLVGAQVHHNTFHDVNLARREIQGAIANDWHLPAGALDVRNNVFSVPAGTRYLSGSVGLTAAQATLSRNLWAGGIGRVALDAAAIHLPSAGLRDPAGGDLRLIATSAARRAALPLPDGAPDAWDDVTGRRRSQPRDLGAYND